MLLKKLPQKRGCVVISDTFSFFISLFLFLFFISLFYFTFLFHFVTNPFLP